jgi:peptidoglycan/xylan/chitin deacetylase (PgdA/CDA1 family)
MRREHPGPPAGALPKGVPHFLRNTLRSLSLLGLVLLFAGGTALGQPLTFGSTGVLKACWSPVQLAGTPRDRIVRRPYHKGPQPMPPDRPVPRHRLAPLPAALRGSIRSVNVRGNAKLLALTFDLCERENERAGYDERVVDYLRRNRVKATFFAGGKWMKSHPEKAMQLMADPLFEVGNHTWTHGNLRVITGRDMKNQVLFAQGEYEVLAERLKARAFALGVGQRSLADIPEDPTLFRFPYGTCTPAALDFLARQGIAAIQWSIVTADPVRAQTAADIARLVLRQARPGAIIIGHANGRGWHTAEALPRYIPELRRKGYRFVTVSELLTAGTPRTYRECFEERPGDNKRYDRLFGRGDW